MYRIATNIRVVQKSILMLIFFFSALFCSAQEEDWAWWNELHGWKPGMPGWRHWLIISPGYLGPNALPVPDMTKGFIAPDVEFALSGSRHFHRGDPTQDISANLRLPFYDSKIAVEIYGVMLENYAFTEEIRNERFARDKDGRGTTHGDFYFSTLVQLTKGRRFPNTLFRFACRTASGGAHHAARYSDAPGYFFDFSFSKDWGPNYWTTIRPYALIGFYSWQTNDYDNLQNDAFSYGAGVDWKSDDWTLSGSFSGYSGYKNQRDKPQVLTFDARHDWQRTAARLQVVYGLRHWEYQTLRFTFIWKWDGI